MFENYKQKRVHILGIAGTLMGAFAVALKKQGIEVTGSDQNIYPPMSDVLKNANIEVFSPYSPSNIEKAKPDLVIVGNVIRRDNPEMLEVVAKNLPYESLPLSLEKNVLPKKHSIVIAGTHGKTTTTSMMAWILECLNLNPSFFIGGVTHNFSESFRITDSQYMVLEGDEYDTAFFDKVPKFVHYLPKDVILTSVEYDHADIYPDMTAVIRAFESLAKITNKDGFFIACSESETTLRIANKTDAHVVTYGFSKNSDSFASNVEPTKDGTKFKWNFGSDTYSVFLPMSGNHNVLNAVSCLTLSALREFNLKQVIDALASFKGVKRRQEIYAKVNGITIIDDFAHHPTAVKETINAIKLKFPNSRIIACFEPRSATSRRKVFQQAYVESFLQADLIFIARPYDQSRIDPKEQFSSENLVQDLQKAGKKAKILETNLNSIKDFANLLRSGDVVLVMSNGSFDGLLPKLVEQLSH